MHKDTSLQINNFHVPNSTESTQILKSTLTQLMNDDTENMTVQK